jgi:hypothetical protein
MQLELLCPHCFSRFGAAPDARSEEIVEQMIEEGPWYALGDGETFEDMVHAALTVRGVIRCPECAEPVEVTEECLGDLTRELLMQW